MTNLTARIFTAVITMNCSIREKKGYHRQKTENLGKHQRNLELHNRTKKRLGVSKEKPLMS
jgi:hypothetical protein